MTEFTINHKPYSGNKGWIGVDLDRTLAEYHGKQDGIPYDILHVGKPIWAMVERIKGWLAEGYEVRIFTARIGGLDEGDLDREIITEAIQNWLVHEAGLPRLRVTATKDMDCCQIWDDIAVRVIPNTGVAYGVAAYEQIEALGTFIMDEVPGEPSQNQGAVDTAIRWMRDRMHEDSVKFN